MLFGSCESLQFMIQIGHLLRQIHEREINLKSTNHKTLDSMETLKNIHQNRLWTRYTLLSLFTSLLFPSPAFFVPVSCRQTGLGRF